ARLSGAARGARGEGAQARQRARARADRRGEWIPHRAGGQPSAAHTLEGRNRGAARLILNIIWFVLAGLWLAIAYALAALVCFILIITIPFGIAALRIAVFALWPFGKTVVRRDDAGAGSAIGNIIWLILLGWWLALAHLITGIALCITIIGIPLGL